MRKALDAVIDAQASGAPPAKVKALLASVRDDVGSRAKF